MPAPQYDARDWYQSGEGARFLNDEEFVSEQEKQADDDRHQVLRPNLARIGDRPRRERVKCRRRQPDKCRKESPAGAVTQPDSDHVAQRDEDDRRVRNLRLTDSGAALMRRRRERRVRRITEVLQSLSEDERQGILGAIQLLAQAAREHAGSDNATAPV